MKRWKAEHGSVGGGKGQKRLTRGEEETSRRSRARRCLVEEQTTCSLKEDVSESTIVEKDVLHVDSQEKESNCVLPDEASGPDENWWNPKDDDVVRTVKECLHVSFHEVHSMPSCREGQIAEISKWMDGCIESRQGNALYLSGVPGTGKTLAAHALVKNAVRRLETENVAPPVAISINCMRLKTATDVLNRIIAGFKTAALKTVSGQIGSDPIIQVPEDDGGFVLSGPWANLAPAEHLKKIVNTPILAKKQTAPSSLRRRRSSISESDLVKQTGLIFLILDEIDGMLEGKHCEEIMGNLISMAASEGSRLAMIGISNSIDLMQQLVRPGAVLHRYNMKPRNIVFPTYLRDQVSRLVQERLDTLPGPVFDKRAVEFCARKIANATGDMRRALEAASVAVDNAVREAKKSGNEEISESASRLVSMRHMAEALNKVSGGIGSSNEHVCTIKKLPVPQQLIMCTVSAMVGENLRARGLKNTSQQKSSQTHIMGMKPSQSLISLPTYRHSASGGTKTLSHIVTLSEIEQSHKTLCSNVGVDVYSSSEFTTAIDVLTTLGLIQVTKAGQKTDLKRSRVQLKIGEDDVWLALADVPVLKHVLMKKT